MGKDIENYWVGVWNGIREKEEGFHYFLNNGLVFATKEEKELYGPAILEYFKRYKTYQEVSMNLDNPEEMLIGYISHNYGIFADFETLDIKEKNDRFRYGCTYKLSESSTFNIGLAFTGIRKIMREDFNLL